MEREDTFKRDEVCSEGPLLGLDEAGEGVDSNKKMQKQSFILRRPGMMWAISASFFQTVYIIMLGKMSNLLNPMQTLFIRSNFLLVFVFFLPWEDSKRYDWKDLFVNLLYGIFDNVGSVVATVAMVLISTSNASAIVYNKPIPASLLTFLILGEAFDVIDGVITILNAIGLVLISKTSIENSQSEYGSSVLGVILSFCALLCLCSLYPLARSLANKDKEDASLLSFTTGWSGIVLPSVYLSVTNSWILPQTLTEISLCFVLGVAAISSFYALAKALQTEKCLLCATAITLSIPGTYCYDVIFIGRVISWQTIVGVCFTVGSSILLYIKSYRNETD